MNTLDEVACVEQDGAGGGLPDGTPVCEDAAQCLDAACVEAADAGRGQGSRRRACVSGEVLRSAAPVNLSATALATLWHRMFRFWLAQKARSGGIYLIIATQKFSEDVINTTVRSNFGAQLALRVKTSSDSRVIMDDGGAETLAGKGAAFLKTSQGLVRLQCEGLSVVWL